MTQTLLDKLEGLKLDIGEIGYDTRTRKMVAMLDYDKVVDVVRNHQSSEASEITQALVSALRELRNPNNKWGSAEAVDAFIDEALAKYESSLTSEDL